MPIIIIIIINLLETSVGQDKPSCTEAITIIDNFKKAMGDNDDR